MKEFVLPPRPYPEQAAGVEEMVSEVRDRAWKRELAKFRALKLTNRQRSHIIRSKKSAREMAAQYGISESYVWQLRSKARNQAA